MEILGTYGERQVQLLTLPSNEKWGFLSSSTLFVRDFYPSFYDEYVGDYKRSSKLIIFGTPGIGKSAFGNYCIYRALRDGKKVVYRTSKINSHWYIYENNSVSYTVEMPSTLLEDFKTVVYISDSVYPYYFDCPTILITSPKKEIWSSFNDADSTQMKFFGVWDRDNELDLLRQHCFPDVTFEVMNSKRELWGPIPHIVLAKPQNYLDSELLQLWYMADPKWLKRDVTRTEKDYDNLHLLFHIIPDENFDFRTKLFASSQLQNLVSTYMKKRHPEVIQQFPTQFRLTESCATKIEVDRSAFRVHCEEVISKGGTFLIRDLDSHEASNVHLDECTTFGYSNTDFFYNHLMSKQNINNTDIDFVTWSPKAFRMFKMVCPGDEAEEEEEADWLSSGLVKLDSSFSKFYFAVPSGRFPLFKKPQRFCNILQEKVGRVHTMKYYAINIPQVGSYSVQRRNMSSQVRKVCYFSLRRFF